MGSPCKMVPNNITVGDQILSLGQCSPKVVVLPLAHGIRGRRKILMPVTGISLLQLFSGFHSNISNHLIQAEGHGLYFYCVQNF